MFMFRPVNAILPARLTLSRTVSLRSTSLLRGYSTKEPNDTLECGDEKPKTVQNERLLRILSKSRTLTKLSRSKRFSHYFDKLSQAGAISTVTSFLVLHELTAIVPLFGMWWVLYNLDLTDQYDLPVYFTDLLNKCGDVIERLVGDSYDGFERNRLVLSGAIAYAAVKLLYPLRVIVSLWGAPYFGNWVMLPFKKLKLKLKNTKKK